MLRLKGRRGRRTRNEGGGSGGPGGIGRRRGQSGKMKRRSEGGVGRGLSERAGLKRCRTLTNLNATCFKLCQSEQETATLETSCVIALETETASLEQREM